MPRHVEDLASRVAELEGEIERLLDEYVEVRRRLEELEAKVGTHQRTAVLDLDLDSDPAEEDPASGDDPDEQAAPEDVDEAVESVDAEPEDTEEETSELDDIIVA